MAENNVVRKSLATMQDFAKGIGEVQQVRGGAVFNLNKVSLATAVANEQALSFLDPTSTHRASIVSEELVREFIEVGGQWEPVDFGNSERSYYNRLKSFTAGNTVNGPRDALYNAADNSYYVWTGGGFPKIVAPNSLPSAGWLNVGGASMLDFLKLGTSAKELAFGASNIYDTLATHGITTSSLGIGSTDINDVTVSDDAAKLQVALNTYRQIVVDTVIRMETHVSSAMQYQVLSMAGIGVMRPVTLAAGNKAMVRFSHKYCRVFRGKFDNPNLYKPTTGDRQGAVSLLADHCSIEFSYFKNQLNAVVAPTTASATGSRVISCLFEDCLGVAAEDRGDAVTLWGSGSVIAFNYATCKEGEDARLAFHFEAPIGGAPNPRPELDAKHNVMIGNHAYGAFRRHFTFEGITNGSCVDNCSMGGATWWGEAYIQCVNVYVRNNIRYTRTSDQNQGASWNPRRSACAIMNYNENLIIESNLYLNTNSAGYGFASGTTTGAHQVEFRGTINNKGLETNIPFFLVTPLDVKLSGKVRGFSLGINYAAGNVPGQTETTPSLLDVDGLDFKGAGSITNSSGTGYRFRMTNSIWDTTSESIVALSNVSDMIVESNKFNCTSYPYNGFNNTRVSFKNNTNMGTNALAVRVQANTTFINTNSDWSFENNTGIACDMVYAEAALTSATSFLNVKHKQPGKVVVVTGSPRRLYAALGSANTQVWKSLTGAADLTPA